MSTPQTIALGAIAGFTIFLGLPVGRMRTQNKGIKTFLSGISAGVLAFLFVEIMEHAGQKLLNREDRDGRIDQMYGFAWVTVYRVAISQLRRTPYLLEQPTTDSAERALSRLTSEHSSPASIESGVLASQVLDRLSHREQMIAIWKRSGFSSREIAEKLEMSVPAVDTAFCRVRQKVQKLLGPGAKLG
jgi:DNA-directed RNA polymerase specialized sigma24 family protein